MKIYPTHVQARNQLGAPGGAKSSERGPNFLKAVQHMFSGEGRKKLYGCLRPPWLGPAHVPHGIKKYSSSCQIYLNAT